MFRDFAVSYKDAVIHARNISEQYRAVIDHSKDIVAMLGNKCILTLFKTNKYSNLLIMSLYIDIQHIADEAMYMYKMGGFESIFVKNLKYLHARTRHGLIPYP